jgi:hypothetical protein
VAETRDLCFTSTGSHPKRTTPVNRQIVERICRVIEAGGEPGDLLANMADRFPTLWSRALTA